MSSAHEIDPPASPGTASPGGWLVGVALGLLTLFLAASALSFWPYTVDDAFISLRYAQNLVEHGELVWNLGERVEGISNPLWTLWGALGLVVHAPVVLWLKGSGLLAGLALVPLTYWLGRRVGLGRAAGLGAAAIVATNASLALWSVAGLETASFALLLTLFALRMEHELRARARGGSALPVSAALFFLCWASRPEAPAYGLYIVVRRFLAGERPPLGRADLVWVLVAGLPIAAYEVFGLAYFGGLLPATHTAKLGGGSSFFGGKFARFLGTRFLFGQGPLFAALWIAGFVGVVTGLRRIPAVAWTMSVAGLVFIAYAFTDWMPRFRFFVPPLPFLALACAFGVERLAGLLTRQHRVAVPVALALLIGGAAFDQGTRGYDRSHNIEIAVDPRGAWPLHVASRARAAWEPGRQEIDALMVLQETPEAEAVACPDIGFIGALARNPIWDIRGLVTPKAAAFLPVEESAPEFEEARRAMLDDMFAMNPAFILVPTRPQGMAPVARRFAAALRQDPRTQAGYDEIPGMLPMRVVWRRRDLVRPTAEERRARIEEGFARFPSYRTDMAESVQR
ncbi:hypothetical protein [Planctomycetes bacterium Poly30]